MQHQLRIDGQLVTIYVNQTGKTVWEASGEFDGHVVTVKASSERSALAQWRKVALRAGD